MSAHGRPCRALTRSQQRPARHRPCPRPCAATGDAAPCAHHPPALLPAPRERQGRGRAGWSPLALAIPVRRSAKGLPASTAPSVASHQDQAVNASQIGKAGELFLVLVRDHRCFVEHEHMVLQRCLCLQTQHRVTGIVEQLVQHRNRPASASRCRCRVRASGRACSGSRGQ